MGLVFDFQTLFQMTFRHFLNNFDHTLQRLCKHFGHDNHNDDYNHQKRNHHNISFACDITNSCVHVLQGIRNKHNPIMLTAAAYNRCCRINSAVSLFSGNVLVLKCFQNFRNQIGFAYFFVPSVINHPRGSIQHQNPKIFILTGFQHHLFQTFLIFRIGKKVIGSKLPSNNIGFTEKFFFSFFYKISLNGMEYGVCHQ